MAVTGIATMATPVFAGGHHHHNNSVKVNQTADQANVCSGSPVTILPIPVPTTLCDNEGSNSADIQR
jgi:hypothetical protein